MIGLIKAEKLTSVHDFIKCLYPVLAIIALVTWWGKILPRYQGGGGVTALDKPISTAYQHVLSLVILLTGRVWMLGSKNLIILILNLNLNLVRSKLKPINYKFLISNYYFIGILLKHSNASLLWIQPVLDFIVNVLL